MHYSTGVLSGTGCGTLTDHDILAVGFGTDSATGEDYFLVKNSWGAEWGESGYVKISTGLDNTYGTCGILRFPLIAVWM